MGPKIKAEAGRVKKRKLKLKDHHPATAQQGCGTESDEMAQKRPRRELKPPTLTFDPAKDEEAAQLEKAIQLSLAAQKVEKKKKDKDKKPAKLPKIKAPLKNTEIKKPKSKLGNSKPEVTASTNNGDSKNNKVMVKKIKQPLKSKPSKLKNTDTGRKQTGANPKQSPKKHTKPSNNRSPQTVKEEIPSTSSFIKYVLQKGARNRDLELVKTFERSESTQDESTTTNTATESESDWEPVSI